MLQQIALSNFDNCHDSCNERSQFCNTFWFFFQIYDLKGFINWVSSRDFKVPSFSCIYFNLIKLNCHEESKHQHSAGWFFYSFARKIYIDSNSWYSLSRELMTCLSVFITFPVKWSFHSTMLPQPKLISNVFNSISCSMRYNNTKRYLHRGLTT